MYPVANEALLRYYRVMTRILHDCYYYDSTRIFPQIDSVRTGASFQQDAVRIKVQLSVGYFQDTTRALEKSVLRYFWDAIRATLTFLGYCQHFQATCFVVIQYKGTTKLLPLQGNRQWYDIFYVLSYHHQHFVASSKLLLEQCHNIRIFLLEVAHPVGILPGYYRDTLGCVTALAVGFQ